MAEEVRNPIVQVPRAMVLSVPIGGLCGLMFLLPIVFTLPDVGTLLSGKDLIQIRYLECNVDA
jgi:amino acid transporter